jgi:hypothetical protein
MAPGLISVGFVEWGYCNNNSLASVIVTLRGIGIIIIIIIIIIIYIGRISIALGCDDVFQGTVFGWDGVANDFGVGRPPTFTLVVLPLNALIFSVSLEQGAEVEGFKNML